LLHDDLHRIDQHWLLLLLLLPCGTSRNLDNCFCLIVLFHYYEPQRS